MSGSTMRRDLAIIADHNIDREVTGMTRKFKGLIACSPSTNRVDIFARAEDGEIWHKTSSGASWSRWTSLGGQGTVAPAVTVSGDNRIELFAIKSSPAGSAWELMHRRYNGTQWSGWVSYGRLRSDELPKSVSLAVAATGNNSFEVFFSGEREALRLWHVRLGGQPLSIIQQPTKIEGIFTPRQIAAFSNEPDVVEIFVRNVGFNKALFSKRFNGSWQATQQIDHPKDWLNKNSYGLAATPKHLFAVGNDAKLWHKKLTDTQTAWEPLGGQLGDYLTATSRGSNVDVFAIWNGVALLHRWFNGVQSKWSNWKVVDLWPGPIEGYSILRPKDLVNLDVHGIGLKKRIRPDGIVELVPEQADARLIVDFPPQHMGEVVEPNPIDARLAGPSRLAFSVKQSESIPLTLPGLLNAIKRLPLLNQDNPPAMPDSNKTAIELPWRLVISPQEKPNCSYRELPGTSTKGVTELWHVRLSGPRASGRLYIRPVAALPGNNLKTPLSADQLNNIARLGRDPAKQQIAVDRLILSALGGWLTATVNWPEMDWSHESAMGRDYYVRVITRGTLFPFGHQAAYVEVYERNFNAGKASLRSTKFLIITETEREYGDGYGGKHERTFPFQRVTIEPRLITPLKDPDWVTVEPSGLLKYFWPKWPSGHSVDFSIHAQAGNESVEMKLPLLFVDKFPIPADRVEKIITIYRNGPDNVGEPTAFVGRTIPLAVKKNNERMIVPLEGAIHEVHSMTFGGCSLNNDVGFYPKVTELKVSLPAVRQLLGQIDPIPVTFSKMHEEKPPGESNVLLDLKDKKRLSFESAAEQTGALASPDFNVNQISRTIGPILGTINPNPSDLFDPDALLLGCVKLHDIITRITNKPMIIWEKVNGATTSTARFNWVEKLNKVVEPFTPKADSQIKLEVVSKMIDGQPKIHTTGELTNFILNMLGVVTLDFNKLCFTANPGQLPSITFDFKEAKLDGKLKFVQTLQSKIPNIGRGGPQIEVSRQEIRATYHVSVPTLALGPVLTLQNLAIDIGLTLSLINNPVSVDFAFGTRERPFLATVSLFGGGGYLELGISAKNGLQRLVGGLEFGASVALDFLVAKAEAHVLGGIVFTEKNKSPEITGYLRIGGSVEVLGLVRISIELTVSLTYEHGPNALIGSALLVATVDLTFWSTSVELPLHYRIDGASLPFAAETRYGTEVDRHASSVENALGPQGESRPWETYCRAFAWEPSETGPEKREFHKE